MGAARRRGKVALCTADPQHRRQEEGDRRGRPKAGDHALADGDTRRALSREASHDVAIPSIQIPALGSLRDSGPSGQSAEQACRGSGVNEPDRDSAPWRRPTPRRVSHEEGGGNSHARTQTHHRFGALSTYSSRVLSRRCADHPLGTHPMPVSIAAVSVASTVRIPPALRAAGPGRNRGHGLGPDLVMKMATPRARPPGVRRNLQKIFQVHWNITGLIAAMTSGQREGVWAFIYRCFRDSGRVWATCGQVMPGGAP